MSRIDAKIMLSSSVWVIVSGAFIGGRGVIEESWPAVFIGVAAIAVGGGIFVDMYGKLEAFKNKDEYRGKDE